MLFTDRLRQLRNELNLTQEELAKMLNYGRTAISGYELGRNNPSPDILQKLANFFNVTVDYLLGNSDERNTHRIDKANMQDSMTHEDAKKLRELGVEYIEIAQEMKDRQISPEEVKMLMDFIESRNKPKKE